MTMTNVEIAILTLIAEAERHGYEIEDLIEQRGMREWTDIGFSSIYYVLNKLEKAGYIGSRREPAPRGPARRVYSILPVGTAALRERALALLATPQKGDAPLLLGLANAPLLETDALIDALEQQAAALREKQAAMQRRRESQLPLPEFVEAIFDYSDTMLNAHLDWLARTIARLKHAEQSEKKP
jgi:DNA-binding PadR family transcriptional regulator